MGTNVQSCVSILTDPIQLPIALPLLSCACYLVKRNGLLLTWRKTQVAVSEVLFSDHSLPK